MNQQIQTRQANEMDILVGSTLRIIRESKGLSQEALGIELNVSSQQIQKYERGANRISAGKLFLCAKVLGVSVCHFFEPCANHPPLPSFPHAMAEKYHNLPLEKQRLVQDMVRILHEEEQG